MKTTPALTKRLLFLDDSQLFIDILDDQLPRLGFEKNRDYWTCSDPREIVSCVNMVRPDIILVDLQWIDSDRLPMDIDGDDIIASLKQVRAQLLAEGGNSFYIGVLSAIVQPEDFVAVGGKWSQCDIYIKTGVLADLITALKKRKLL